MPHLYIALTALGAVVVTVVVTMILQRQARHEKRLTHVEDEIGIGEDERHAAAEGKIARRPHSETIRVKLHAIERSFDAVLRRHRRAPRAR